jgi:hypothetical protein
VPRNPLSALVAVISISHAEATFARKCTTAFPPSCRRRQCARWGLQIIFSVPSRLFKIHVLRRSSCDWVKAVGVSGISSSSDMGDGIRRPLSSSTCADLRACCRIGLLGTPRYPLLMLMPPAIPLLEYPSPPKPPVWKFGYMGVGTRPVLFADVSRPKRFEFNFAGRIDGMKEESRGGLAMLSRSSSSISISVSKLL